MVWTEEAVNQLTESLKKMKVTPVFRESERENDAFTAKCLYPIKPRKRKKRKKRR